MNNSNTITAEQQTTYTQTELLSLINQYNQTPRKLIKQNLRKILTTHNLEPKQLIEIGYSSPTVYAWLAPKSKNMPMLEQILNISNAFDFSIEEFLKEIE